jgi:predicted ATP-grasp superfamily ATP-dependent carboligase
VPGTKSDAKPPAAVVDVGWVNGLAAIRSLGRGGVHVLAVDHRASALGFRSRYADTRVSPDVRVDEEAFVDFFRGLGEVVVFPTHDAELNVLARHADELSLLAPFPSWDMLERVQSKRVQLETAQAAGVDIPALDPSTFPVIVKPDRSVEFKQRYKRQAFRCETPAELEDALAKTEEFGPIVQDFVPGGDDTLYTVGTYITRDGRALGVFSGRKLRQTPPGGVGTCRVGEAVWVEEAVDAALRLLKAFGYFGLSQIEFKRDPRDGRFKLMEINPRLWQWHGLASACGVDLPRIAYADLLGEPPPVAQMNGFGKRWSISLLPGESSAFQRPPYVDAVFALDDPKPAAVHLARYFRSRRR